MSTTPMPEPFAYGRDSFGVISISSRPRAGYTGIFTADQLQAYADARAAEALEAQAAELTKLRTVMAAAAEEIHAHWDAHCDADGYGPANLMRRLEEGIAVEYGYTAGRFAEQEKRIAALEAATRRWMNAADKWLATGEPASPEESRSIYEQAGAVLDAQPAQAEPIAWVQHCAGYADRAFVWNPSDIDPRKCEWADGVTYTLAYAHPPVAQPPQAEPVADSWESNAQYLLDKCPHTVWQRPGAGPVDLLSTLVVTFMGMQQRLAVIAAKGSAK